MKSAPCMVGPGNSQFKRRTNDTAYHVRVSHKKHNTLRPGLYHHIRELFHSSFDYFATLPPTTQRRSPLRLQSRPSSSTISTNSTLLRTMSATKGTCEAVATTATPKLKGFFSLPRELRDEIYDIIHQHDVEVEMGYLTFSFRCPPINTRLINRRFTNEFDMRALPTNRSQLSVTENPTKPDWAWAAYNQPRRLPKLPVIMQDVTFTRLEFKFDASDEYQELELDYDHYKWWIKDLIKNEPCLLSSSGGHELHLKLSFQYISNLEQAPDLISNHEVYTNFFATISLVLHGIPKPTSTMERLGLYVYSEKPQTLSIWSRATGWQVEEVVSKQAQIECLSNLDPFEP